MENAPECAEPRKHIPIVICVPLPGKTNKQGYVFPRKHLSLRHHSNICLLIISVFPLTHIPSRMYFSYPGTVPSDMRFSSWNIHITSDMR